MYLGRRPESDAAEISKSIPQETSESRFDNGGCSLCTEMCATHPDEMQTSRNEQKQRLALRKEQRKSKRERPGRSNTQQERLTRDMTPHPSPAQLTKTNV